MTSVRIHKDVYSGFVDEAKRRNVVYHDGKPNTPLLINRVLYARLEEMKKEKV